MFCCVSTREIYVFDGDSSFSGREVDVTIDPGHIPPPLLLILRRPQLHLKALK